MSPEFFIFLFLKPNLFHSSLNEWTEFTIDFSDINIMSSSILTSITKKWFFIIFRLCLHITTIARVMYFKIALDTSEEFLKERIEANLTVGLKAMIYTKLLNHFKL